MADLQPIDLNALVTEVLSCTAAPPRLDMGRWRQRGFGSKNRLPADLGDAQQLRQVIHNLVQNASTPLKARHAPADRGDPVVIVRARSGSTTCSACGCRSSTAAADS